MAGLHPSLTSPALPLHTHIHTHQINTHQDASISSFVIPPAPELWATGNATETRERKRRRTFGCHPPWVPSIYCRFCSYAQIPCSHGAFSKAPIYLFIYLFIDTNRVYSSFAERLYMTPTRSSQGSKLLLTI
uniref:Uncharacterized protein n=1 Tax=Physcomitrium patens TaxID=3218 RepID=A0A2K1ITI5_PHYPA|nr:hypothetical protein PHYPA_024523 [Physcomitrium patens]